MEDSSKLLEIVLDLSMRVYLLENTFNKLLLEKKICSKEELESILEETKKELESLVR